MNSDYYIKTDSQLGAMSSSAIYSIRLELIVYLIIYDLSWKMLNSSTEDVQMICNVLPSVFRGDSVGSGRPKSNYENIYLLPLKARNPSLDIV